MWPSADIASKIYNLANFILIGSLIFGVVSTSFIVWMGNIKEEYLNLTIAKANTDAARSLERATEAQKNLVEANEKAAKAEQKAAEAQLALEKFKAPRLVSKENQQLIVAKITEFAGQEYHMTTFWDLKEPLNFSEQLNQILQIAGWKFIPPGEGGAFLLGGLGGIQVWIHPEADLNVKNAANALVSVLEKLGFSPKLMLQNPKNQKFNFIDLNIGTKQ